MMKKKMAKNRRFMFPPKSVIILKLVLYFLKKKLFSCEIRINRQTIRKKERKSNRKTERGREERAVCIPGWPRQSFNLLTDPRECEDHAIIIWKISNVIFTMRFFVL